MPLIHVEPKRDLTNGFLLMHPFTLASVAGLVESLRFAADDFFPAVRFFAAGSGWPAVTSR